jgi:hypothetical protein
MKQIRRHDAKAILRWEEGGGEVQQGLEVLPNFVG